MRKRLALCIALILFISCKSDEPRQWVNYSAKDNSFSIDIPQGFKEQVDEENVAFENRTVFSVYWRINAIAIASMDIKLLQCSYYDVSHISQRFTNDIILDSSVRFLLDSQYNISSRGRVIKIEKIASNEFPGRNIIAIEQIDQADSLLIFVRKYVVGKRLYTILANGYKDYTDSTQVYRFLNSFKLYQTVATD